MEIISNSEMVSLSKSIPSVNAMVARAYSELLGISGSSFLQNSRIIGNQYFVNDKFPQDPQWLVAHRPDGSIRVLQVVYVREDLRNSGLGSSALTATKAYRFSERILQVGVEVKADFQKLDHFYTKNSFRAAPQPVDHGGGKIFRDYFWSEQQFEILQNGGKIDIAISG